MSPEARARMLGGLKPAKKGEVRNPTGNNGRRRSEFIAKFLEEADDTLEGRKLVEAAGCPPDTSRIKALLQKDFLVAMDKGDFSRSKLIEQYGGKPRQQMEVTTPDGGDGAKASGVIVLPLAPATIAEFEAQGEDKPKDTP